MSNDLDLKELERKAWSSYSGDGLWDIFLGLLLFCIGMALGPLNTLIASEGVRLAVFYILLGGTYLVFWAGRRYITTPRLGRVKFSPQRRRKKKVLSFILGGFLLVTVILFLLTLGSNGDSTTKPADIPVFVYVGLFVGGLVAIITWFNDIPRGYYIAVVYALSFGLSEILDTTMLFFIGGLLVIIPGVVFFARFLREHPEPADEVADDQPGEG